MSPKIHSTLCGLVVFFTVFQYISTSALPAPRDSFKNNDKDTAILFGSESTKPLELIQFTDDSVLSLKNSQLEGCPNVQTNLQRYDKKARKCSQIGRKSHCGKNMIFYSYNNSKTYGQCDCDYNTHVPLIYHQKTDRCYFIYQQGNCKQDEWLDINPKTGKSFCSANKCFDYGRTAFGSLPLASQDTVPEYVPLEGNGECVKLNQPNEKCRKGDLVTFKWPSQLYAKCNAQDIQSKNLSVGSTLRCSPGTYLTLFGKCQFAFDFD